MEEKKYYALTISKKDNILKHYQHVGFTVHRKQERLIRQVKDIILTIGGKMTEKNQRNADDQVVFVGNKPFMNQY